MLDDLSLDLVGARFDNVKRNGKPKGGRKMEILLCEPGDKGDACYRRNRNPDKGPWLKSLPTERPNMKKLMIFAALVALPTIAAAQSQLGNGMGSQSSAAPSSDSSSDPSNAGKTPTGMSSHSMHHSTQSHAAHAHKMSKSPTAGDANAATPR